MKKKILFLIVFSLCFGGELSLMFWNVENLFDIYDDPGTRDGDFMPGGSKRYTYRAYRLKSEHLADVINRVSPDILGMVEVENENVLKDLAARLRHADDWEILIHPGPDIRGIDPALMYRKDRAAFVACSYYPVFISERGYHSRPIMRVDLAVNRGRDTLSVFINHWPSRRGGKPLSDPYRNYAADILLQAVRETVRDHPGYAIVMTGDFNDDAHDTCLQRLSKHPEIDYRVKRLPGNVRGTYYYDGEWIHFDHFLTSNIDMNRLFVKEAYVFAPGWIREAKTNGPFRFYHGVEILGGYSDHFPICLKLGFTRKNVE